MPPQAAPPENAWRAWREIVASGVDAVALHPVRNAVTAACLVAMLVPYVAGVSVARGLHQTAHHIIAEGPDVVVRAERLGLPAPLPRSLVGTIAALDGVTRAAPHIEFPIVLGADAERATLVGVAPDDLELSADAVEGRVHAPGNSHELVVGAALADALALEVGSKIPPFYRNPGGERIATVVGVLHQDASPWLSRTVFTSLETAAWIAGEEDTVTRVLVTTDGADTAAVVRAIERLAVHSDGASAASRRLEATTRDDLEFLLPAELFHREAALHLLYMLVFSVGIPVVLVSAGAGHDVLRRENALLRATGWQVDEILVRTTVENLAVAGTGVAAAVVLAWAWLEFAGGAGLAPLFLRGDPALAGGPLPYVLAPGPILLAIAAAVVVVLVGTLSLTWSAVSAPPARSMS